MWSHPSRSHGATFELMFVLPEESQPWQVSVICACTVAESVRIECLRNSLDSVIVHGHFIYESLRPQKSANGFSLGSDENSGKQPQKLEKLLYYVARRLRYLRSHCFEPSAASKRQKTAKYNALSCRTTKQQENV